MANITPLWEHQQRAVDFARDKPGSMLAMEMGTGKSLCAVHLTALWEAQRIFILCPKSVTGVWKREFEKHAPGMFDVCILNKGTVKQKTDQAKLHLSIAKAKTRPAIFVINYESAWREPFAKWAQFDANFDLVIFDESHKIKSYKGKASRFCASLNSVPRKLCLTGTPMPHSPGDIFAQYRTICPDIFGTNWYRFRNHYAQMGGFQGKQITAWVNTEELQENFRSHAFQVHKDDVLDLPDVQDIDIPIQLDSKTRRIYDKLNTEFYCWLEEHQDEVTVTNALTKLLRLQQCTSGFAKAENNGIVQIGEEKQNTLADLIEGVDPSSPVVVFARFREDLNVIKRVAESLGRVYGEVSGSRKDLTDHSTMPDHIQVMGVQIQSGGVGIDLTRANIAVYYSMGYSLGDYVQSLARLHRPGQDRPVAFFHLIANNTIDLEVYKALQAKQNVIASILEIDPEIKKNGVIAQIGGE